MVLLHPPTRVDGEAELDLTNPVHQLRVMRRLVDEWSAHISDTDLSTALFILRHTVLFSRATYKFTYRMIRDGMGEKLAGTGRSEDRTRSSLKNLSSLGIIAIENDGRGMTITVNPKWRPTMLPVPKRKQGPQNYGVSPRGIAASDPAELQPQTPHYCGGFIVQEPRTLPQNQEEKSCGRPAMPADRLPNENFSNEIGERAEEVRAIQTGPAVQPVSTPTAGSARNLTLVTKTPYAS